MATIKRYLIAQNAGSRQNEKVYKAIYEKKVCRYSRHTISGPFKSVQRIISEIRDDCGEKYMEDLEKACG